MSEIGTEPDAMDATQQSYQHSVQERNSLYVAGVAAAEEGERCEEDPFKDGSLRSRSEAGDSQAMVADDAASKGAAETTPMLCREPTPPLEGAEKQPSVIGSVKSSAKSNRSGKSGRSASPQSQSPRSSVRDDEPQEPPPVRMVSGGNPFQFPSFNGGAGRTTPAASETTSYAAEMSIANSRNTKLGYNSASSPTATNHPSGSLHNPASGKEVTISDKQDFGREDSEEEEAEEPNESDYGREGSADPMFASCVPGPLFSPYEPPEQQDQNELSTTVKKKPPVRHTSQRKSKPLAPSPVRSPPNLDTQTYNNTTNGPRDTIREVACDVWDVVQRKMDLEKARLKETKAKKEAAIEKRRQAREEVVHLRAGERANQFHARERYPEKRFDVHVGTKTREPDRVGSLWLTESSINYEEIYGVQPVSSPGAAASPQRPSNGRLNSVRSPGSSSPTHGMRTIQVTRSALQKARLTPDAENSIDAIARLKKLKSLSASSALLRCPKMSAVNKPSSTANPHHPEWRLNPDGTMLLPNGMLYNLAEHPSLRRGYYSP